MGNAMYRKQVTNKEYQSWTGYPDSIVKTVDYPYQALAWSGGVVRLYCSSVPLKVSSGHNAFQVASTVIDGHYLIWQYDPSGGTWVYYTDGWYMGIAAIEQANHDVYEQDGTTVYFAKTTTTEQDGGSTTSLIRIRNLHHKDGVSRDKAAFWLEKIASGYQKWTGYSDSPASNITYPYQAIFTFATMTFLEVSTIKNYISPSLIVGSGKLYLLTDGVWALNNSDWTYTNFSSILQSNYSVYTDNSYATVYFAKTTTSAQDAGISETPHRINM